MPPKLTQGDDDRESISSKLRINVDLSSIDAMFARVIAEASAAADKSTMSITNLKEYIKNRLDLQDQAMEEIKHNENNCHADFDTRLSVLEKEKEVRGGERRMLTAVWGAVAGIVAIVIDKLVEYVFWDPRK